MTLLYTKNIRRNIVEDKFFAKVKNVATGIYMTEGILSRKIVIAVSIGIV